MPKYGWTVGLLTCLMSSSSPEDGIGLISVAQRGGGEKAWNSNERAGVTLFVTGNDFFGAVMYTQINFGAVMSRLISVRLAQASQYFDLGQSNQPQSTSRRLKTATWQRRQQADTANQDTRDSLPDDRVVRNERRTARSGLDQSVYTTRSENVDKVVAGLVSDKHERRFGKKQKEKKHQLESEVESDERLHIPLGRDGLGCVRNA